MPRAAISVLTLVMLAVLPAAADADGLPVPMDGFGTTSVVEPSGEGPRYATVDAGDDTQLLRIDQDGGEITGTKPITGEFTVPLVAIDGTPSGLAADGETLVLISPRTNFDFPRRETTFVEVDVGATGRMHPHDPLTLRGDFSFDALSPDGTSMFLIEYLSRDYNDYAVREYDMERQRLLPDPVLVTHVVEPDEMRGLPLTRATSSDGRWEYTLYNGGGRRKDHAFIHTLDTERSLTHCIDLLMVHGQEAWRVDLALSGDGGTLDVMRGSDVLASLDTETFALDSSPAAEPPVAESDGGGLSGVAVGAIAAGIAALAGAFLGIRRRRRGAELPADPFGPGEPGPEAPDAEPEPERERVST